MANIINLSWTASVSYDDPNHDQSNNWIRINPTAYTGDKQVSVQVEQAECYGETDLTGVITFTCSECPEEQRTKTINVTRCAPTDCGKPIITITYDDVEISAGKCDTTKEVSVPFTSTTSYSICGCPPETTTDSKIVTVEFEKNESSEERIWTITDREEIGDATITIIQEAGPCTCNCNELTVSPTSLTWAWDELTEKTIEIEKAECLSITNISGGQTNFNVTTGETSIVISPKGENTGSSSKTGTITIKYNVINGSSCTDKTISLTQTAYVNPCSIKTITITPTNGSGECEGGSVTFTATTTTNS